MTLKRLARSRTLSFILKGGLTLFAFWIVFRGIELEHLLHIIQTQDRTMLLEAVLVMILQIILGGERWRLVLNAMAPLGSVIFRVIPCQRIYYIGSFFTCCLPGTVGGDVIRIWLVKDEGIATSHAINSVVIDRMIALACIGILVLIMLPWAQEIVPIPLWLVYAASLLLTVAGYYLLRVMESRLSRWQHVHVVSWLLHFLKGIHQLMSKRKLFVVAIIMALTAHSCYAISGYFLARSLGLDMSVVQSLTFFPIIMLVTTIPISIGGWGVREASTVALLGLIGIGQEAAFILSIQLGVLLMLVCVPAGFIWLLQRKRHRIEEPMKVPGVSNE